MLGFRFFIASLFPFSPLLVIMALAVTFVLCVALMETSGVLYCIVDNFLYHIIEVLLIMK